MTTPQQSDLASDLVVAPEPEFRIVRVRKPDGTIIKVRRPINKAPTTSTPAALPATSGLSPAPPRVVQTPASEVVHAISATQNVSQPTPRSVILESPAVEPARSKDPPKVLRSVNSPEETPQTPAPVLGTTQEAALRSKPGSTYRLYRRLHRIHRHASAVAGAFTDSSDLDRDDADDTPDSDNDSVSGSDPENSDEDEHKNSTQPGGKNDDGNSIHTAADSHQQDKDTASSAGTGRNEKSHEVQMSSRHKTTNQSTPRRATPTIKGSPMPAKTAEVLVNEKEVSSDNSLGIGKLHGIQAHNLGRRTSSIAQLVIWAIMVLIPTLFVVLAIMTAVLTGRRSPSTMGTAVSEANKIAVSLWPIVFAAILAQSLRMLASYKVERGLRLMTLEQLISSHSVASAIKQPFFLRRINLLSIALLCLWSLSPLAGQALLRMSFTGPGSARSPTTLGYLDTLQHNIVFGNDSYAEDPGYFTAETNGIYSAAILQPILDLEADDTDTWDNPRIPLLEELEAEDEPDVNGWYSTTDSTMWSSMIGVPLQSFPDNGSYDFTMQSSYMTLNCSFLNATTMAVIKDAGQNLTATPSQTLFMRITQPDNVYPGNITFVSYIQNAANDQSPDNETVFAYSVCQYTQSFVTSHLNCSGNSCFVDSIRRMTSPPPAITVGPKFIESFVNASGSALDGVTTMTERYIVNPTAADKENFDNFDISKVPLSLFNQRLGLLVSTFWQTGFAPMFQTLGLDPANEWGVTVNYTTDAVYTNTSTVYATSWPWLVLLLVSSVVLLVAGMAGAIWDSQTIGPDILGFASSIVRHSKYVKVPDGGSAMGGPERARLLGDVEVMLQDVRAGKEVGKIALGSITESTQRLKRGRLYK
ncbi:hypothetical protein MMC27_005403 [Xylographa pallens]|nr:hypothetical protein [Xylographa pallens]